MTAYEAPTTDRKDSLQPTSREIWASKYALKRLRAASRGWLGLTR